MPRTKKPRGWTRASMIYRDDDPTGDPAQKQTALMVGILRSHADSIEAGRERLAYFKIETLESDEERAKRLAARDALTAAPPAPEGEASDGK